VAGSRSLYPNEIDSNFGFVPFGGGQRKCVGDQFAMMEAVVILSSVLSQYDLALAGDPESVGWLPLPQLPLSEHVCLVCP